MHRAFKVEWVEPGSGARSEPSDVVRRGVVTYDGCRAEVSVTHHPDHVHAVAFGLPGSGPGTVELHTRVQRLDAPGSPWAGPLETLRERFTADELDGVYSLQSAAVRVGARVDLARSLSIDERRLEIVCDPGPPGRSPPRVVLDGERANADISLSHDGRWIAWAFWLTTDVERT